MTLDDFDAYIGKVPWTVAKTMPKNPHQYTLRKNAPESGLTEQDFEAVVMFIREIGKPVVFARKQYIVIDHKGRRYWTMGDPLWNTWVLNRRDLTEDEMVVKNG